MHSEGHGKHDMSDKCARDTALESLSVSFHKIKELPRP